MKNTTTPNERLIAACEATSDPMRASLVRQALLDGADPDCDINDYKYPTLLVHEVVEQRCDVGVPVDFEVMDLLIDAGADIHVETPHAVGDGAFGFAVAQGFYKAAHHLISRGAEVDRYNVFWEFVLYNGDFNDQDIELVRAMVMTGVECGELIEEMRTRRSENCSSDSTYFLTDRDEYWLSESPTMIDLLEQWVAEREATKLDKAWQQAGAAPPRVRF